MQAVPAAFSVCPACGTMLARGDSGIAVMGVAAQLPADHSPLQIGTKGEFEGESFTLIGRWRVGYPEGAWTEWCALYLDGHYGCVTETQGFFMAGFETLPPADFPPVRDLKSGKVVWLDQELYRLTDRKDTVCLGVEGEMPFAAPAGREELSLDFTAPAGKFLTVKSSGDQIRLITGRILTFAELKFSNLRAVPGWEDATAETAPAPPAAVDCPYCGTAVSLRAAGLTLSVACPRCGSGFANTDPRRRILWSTPGERRVQPRIPLGARGTLFGVCYEVIGFQRIRVGSEVSWEEYLLFNPWAGFVWLIQSDGHWTFVRRLLAPPEIQKTGLAPWQPRLIFQGESYRFFSTVRAVTDSVLGEFYWQLRPGDVTQVTDYVCPPKILSSEEYPGLGEATWSLGEYVEPKLIRRTFGAGVRLTARTGVYLNQPNQFAVSGWQLAWLVPVLVVLFSLLHFAVAHQAENRKIIEFNGQYQALGTNETRLTDTFTMPGRRAVEVQLRAPVDNHWLEFEVEVVNADTHELAASLTQEVAYYEGYDDGAWSEGRQMVRRLIPALPMGRYYLALAVSADPGISTIPFSVTVIRDVVPRANYIIALLLLLVYPVYVWIRAAFWEQARWRGSGPVPLGMARK